MRRFFRRLLVVAGDGEKNLYNIVDSFSITIIVIFIVVVVTSTESPKEEAPEADDPEVDPEERARKTDE